MRVKKLCFEIKNALGRWQKNQGVPNVFLGKKIELITPHRCYRKLGRSRAEHQNAYAGLFKSRIPAVILDEITEATNKAWVLGNDRFKRKIERQTGRPTEPRQQLKPDTLQFSALQFSALQ